jgi:hypothetical protein
VTTIMGNRRLGALVLTVLVAVSVARQAVAQTPAPTAALDSITCWWKANRTTVHVGEHFRLVLTCGIPRDDSADLVPDWKQLDPGAIQLAPYEVLAGVRHQDVDAGASRYIQYEYTLRLLDSAAFGQEVDIPSLAVTYGVEVTQGGTTQRGRERQYLLPPLPMQIASLVPKNAADIRDASDETFGSIEARRFRATSKLVAAVVFFCISVVLAALAGASALRRYRAPMRDRGRPAGMGRRSRRLDPRSGGSRGGGLSHRRRGGTWPAGCASRNAAGNAAPSRAASVSSRPAGSHPPHRLGPDRSARHRPAHCCARCHRARAA